MLLSVEEALGRIIATARETETIDLPLHQADGYALAETLVATRDQPPFATSAMDGYAVRHADLHLGQALRIIGQAAAGHQYQGGLAVQQAIRIFTGAPLPKGADTILIQEDGKRDGDWITPAELPVHGLYVRPAGMDFKAGDKLLAAGTVLNFQTLSLAAAMNRPVLPVHRKPRVAILSNGDELVYPGEKPRDDQIVASNAFGVASLVRANGGEVIDLGIVRDSVDDIGNAFDRASEARSDIIVTLGGASVGEHDLVRPALAGKNATLDFWKIAMRPGKPFMFGALGKMTMLGMPGNPVSSLVCSLLFLRPLLLAMQGRDPAYPIQPAILKTPLPANSFRQAYLRAYAEKTETAIKVSVFENQDSSLLSVFAKANCLIIQKGNAAAAKIGDSCNILLIET